MSTLTLQPQRVPLIDLKTGLITMPWYKYLLGLQTRVGGGDPPDLTALTALVTANATAIDGAAQAPQFQDHTQGDNDQTPPMVWMEPIDPLVPPYEPAPVTQDPHARLEALESEMARLRKEIEGLSMSPEL